VPPSGVDGAGSVAEGASRREALAALLDARSDHVVVRATDGSAKGVLTAADIIAVDS